eukprot:5774601-Pyramimonas_sp.AAC.1
MGGLRLHVFIVLHVLSFGWWSVGRIVAEPHKHVLLASYPNSGTTLSLELISAASGVATEAVYYESENRTEWGTWAHLEFAPRMPGDGDVSVVKNHGLPLVDDLRKQKQRYNVFKTDIKQTYWEDFCKRQRWMYLQWHCRWDQAVSATNIPRLDIAYEDLLTNQSEVLKKMLDFTGRPYTEKSIRAAVNKNEMYDHGVLAFPLHKDDYSESLLESTSQLADLPTKHHCDVVKQKAKELLDERGSLCDKARQDGCCRWDRNLQFFPKRCRTKTDSRPKRRGPSKTRKKKTGPSRARHT